MEDIEINTPLKTFHYWFSWFGFIISFSVVTWGIALLLARFGKNNYKNTKPKEYVLNQTWQKFVFIAGSVIGYWVLFLLSLILLKLLFPSLGLG